MNEEVEAKIIGRWRYQFLHFLLFQWITILQACNIAFMALGKYLPPIDCDGCGNERDLSNTTTDQNVSLEKCANETIMGEAQFHSVAIEWRLYCTKEKIPYLILTTQMMGILIGSLIAGQLSDMYGRRKVLLVALSGQLTCATGSAFSTGWRMFLVIRFFIGLFGGGTHTTNQVYFAEAVSAKNRLWMSNIGGWPLSIGVCFFIAWLTKEWRLLTLYSNLMCMPTLFLLWYLAESSHWLLLNGAHKKVATKTASSSGFSDGGLSDHGVEMAGKANEDDAPSAARRNQKTRFTYLHLLTSPGLRNYALVVALTHFTSSCIAHGIMFHADALSGDIYVNLFLLAVSRWLTNILTIIADKCTRCGRKSIYIIPCFGISVCCAIIMTMVLIGGRDLAVTALAVTAAALSSPLWISTLLWPAELFPTNIRNIASGLGGMFDRLGGIMIPQILLLAKAWPGAPYAVFAGLAISASVAVAFVLPETKGRPLPDNMPVEQTRTTWEKEILIPERRDDGSRA